jgi:hypothetical protein
MLPCSELNFCYFFMISLFYKLVGFYVCLDSLRNPTKFSETYYYTTTLIKKIKEKLTTFYFSLPPPTIACFMGYIISKLAVPIFSLDC